MSAQFVQHVRPADADRHPAAIGWIVAAILILAALLASGAAQAQGLTVLPVSIQMAPGQMAAALTVQNHTDSETSFQIRAFSWNQQSNTDQLAATNDIVASPPLATIPANGSQVVRIVLRRPPQGAEASYRIWLDQIPAATAPPGMVRIALRLSIPIFAEPTTRAAPHLTWRVETGGGRASLVVTNDGSHHESVRDIVLASSDGRMLRLEASPSPYVLAGATRRWQILASVPATGARLKLTASTDTGRIDQAVPVVSGP
ncbi:MAG TPA: fimbria/pilus periplasmic chaperone [Acetobacteraceae bacterium]|nr:fimbria/pilus periplasmic chaperone [Acetobacteraceae bacterium]